MPRLDIADAFCALLSISLLCVPVCVCVHRVHVYTYLKRCTYIHTYAHSIQLYIYVYIQYLFVLASDDTTVARYNFILIAHNFDSPRDKIKRIIIDDTRTARARLEWPRIQLKQSCCSCWARQPRERKASLPPDIFEESSNLPPTVSEYACIAAKRTGIYRALLSLLSSPHLLLLLLLLLHLLQRARARSFDVYIVITG